MQFPMRNLAVVVALIWLSAGEALAGDQACLLDTESYAFQASELAKAHPGARIDAVTGTVSWSSRQHGQVEVRVGGCQHFGLRVRSIRELGIKGERETRKFAAELARSYWPEPIGKKIAAAILSTRPTQTTVKDGQFTFEFAVSGFENVVLVYWVQGGKTGVEVTSSIPT